MKDSEYLKKLEIVFSQAVKNSDFVQALAVLELMRTLEDEK